mgnify:CR=1 FL=1
MLRNLGKLKTKLNYYIDKTSEKGKGLMKRIKNQKKSLHYNAFQKSIKSLYFP